MTHRALIAVAVSCMLFAPRSTGVRPAAQAATRSGDPRIEITVLGDQVRWFGEPGVVVRAELRGPHGLKATAAARNTSFNVSLRFTPVTSGGDPLIRPGDEVVVTPEEGPLVRVAVPELAADVDAAADRIVGRAPPGSVVEVLRNFDEPLGMVASGAAGDVEVNLSGRHDIARGFTGQLRFVAADDIAFTTWFDVADVAAWVDTERLEVRASLGTTVTVTVVPPGGAGTRHAVTFSRPVHFSTPFRCPDCPRLEPGTAVTVTKRGALPALDSVWAGRVPPLGVRLDRGANRVHIAGPPGGTVVLEAGDSDGLLRGRPAVSEAIAMDATGRFVLDLAGRAEVIPGWMARLNHPVGPGVTLFGEDLLRVVRAGLWGTYLEGIVAPEATVTVTLAAPDGSPKAQGLATSSQAGFYTLRFGSVASGSATGGPMIAPGDTLILEEASVGDPVMVEVPHVTVQADAGTDTISGNAPPAYEVVVGVGQSTVSRTATRQGDRYAASFSGVRDLVPAMGGPLALKQRTGRFEFHTCWAITDLDLILGVADTDGEPSYDARIRGRACAGRTVQVRWLTPDGRLVGHLRLPLRPKSIQSLWNPDVWTAVLQDSSGRGLEMEPGDRFVVDVGDDHVELAVPELTVEADVRADEIGGRTLPNHSVAVSARRRGDLGAAYGNGTTSDASGRYRFDARGAFDIQHGDQVSAGITTPEGYHVGRHTEAPGLRLDLAAAAITGVSVPDGEVLAVVHDGRETRATATGRTAHDGAFDVVMRESDGRPLRPRAGDVVRVTVRGAGGADEMTMIVPDLTLTVDRAAGAVRGRATPGGALVVEAMGTFFSSQGTDGIGTMRAASVAIGADGTWALPLGDVGGTSISLFPGLLLRAQYRLPEGHLVVLGTTVPVVNVEHGGPHVCGAGPAGALVVATATDAAGTPRGWARGQVGDDARYALVLRESSGEPIATRAGDAVRVEVGGETIEVMLPSLVLGVQWRAMRTGWAMPETLVTGSGPALRQVYLRAPVRDCFTGAQVQRGIQEYLAGTGDDGTFRKPIDHQVAGGGVELAFLAPDRHRFYRHARRGQVRVHIDTDRVTGRGMPLQPITITLGAADGVLLGGGHARVDADGRFDLRLKDPAGRPVTGRAGGIVGFVSGGDAGTVAILPLSFDFDSAAGLFGLAHPSARVALALRLIDGTVRRFELAGAADGRFRFTPSDVPAREGWSLADVRHLELVLPLDDGHEIVAETHLGWSAPSQRLFLPFALRATPPGRRPPPWPNSPQVCWTDRRRSRSIGTVDSMLQSWGEPLRAPCLRRAARRHRRRSSCQPHSRAWTRSWSKPAFGKSSTPASSSPSPTISVRGSGRVTASRSNSAPIWPWMRRRSWSASRTC